MDGLCLNYMDELCLDVNLRVRGDRRKSHPFGAHGPWLTTGKMGGLIVTDRRKADRRAADKQDSSK